MILIQPHEGVYNKVLKPWIPLSLLCAASKLDLENYPITIIDQRTDSSWKDKLEKALADGPICVGITSMSGSQIRGALEASKLVRKLSKVPIVWGGVHCTIFPAQTIASDDMDILVKGEGEETFYQLVKRLEAGESLEGLEGLCYKHNGEIVENPDRDYIKPDDYAHVPYHLVNVEDYLHQFFSEKRVVEIESSRGCPFSCAFCYNNLYNKGTWRALSASAVVDRICRIIDQYGIRAFHFIDDAFFINKKRAREIMQTILDKDLQIKMGFQGIRVDTVCKMDDSDLELLCEAGGRFLQFGVESGSPRILEIINKQMKVEDAISTNRRLAAFPQIIPYYNFMCGFPTETKEDVFKTTSLAWTLLRENKNALISPFHHFKPYPGTELAKTAISEDFHIPETLEEWGDFDWTQAIDQKEAILDRKLMKKIEMASILADRKMERQADSVFWTIMAKLYRPIARFRLKNNFYSMMPESILMK